MDVKDMLLDNIRSGINLINVMTAEMTPEQLHWNPPGTAHSVAAVYIHAATATDAQLHSLFQGGAPRFMTDWAGKTGINKPTFEQDLEWAQTVRIEDMAAFQSYSQAIYEELEAYIQNLSQEDLERPIDMSILNEGEKPLGWCLNYIVAAHLNTLAGEISAIKGVQGLVGYPF